MSTTVGPEVKTKTNFVPLYRDVQRRVLELLHGDCTAIALYHVLLTQVYHTNGGMPKRIPGEKRSRPLRPVRIGETATSCRYLAGLVGLHHSTVSDGLKRLADVLGRSSASSWITIRIVEDHTEEWPGVYVKLDNEKAAEKLQNQPGELLATPSQNAARSTDPANSSPDPADNSPDPANSSPDPASMETRSGYNLAAPGYNPATPGYQLARPGYLTELSREQQEQNKNNIRTNNNNNNNGVEQRVVAETVLVSGGSTPCQQRWVPPAGGSPPTLETSIPESTPNGIVARAPEKPQKVPRATKKREDCQVSMDYLDDSMKAWVSWVIIWWDQLADLMGLPRQSVFTKKIAIQLESLRTAGMLLDEAGIERLQGEIIYSDYLSHRADWASHKPDLSWILNPDNLQKIFNQAYRNRGNTQPVVEVHSAGDHVIGSSAWLQAFGKQSSNPKWRQRAANTIFSASPQEVGDAGGLDMGQMTQAMMGRAFRNYQESQRREY